MSHIGYGEGEDRERSKNEMEKSIYEIIHSIIFGFRIDGMLINRRIGSLSSDCRCKWYSITESISISS